MNSSYKIRCEVIQKALTAQESTLEKVYALLIEEEALAPPFSVVHAYATRGKIAAIKEARVAFELGLIDAKRLVEHWMSEKKLIL